MIPLVVIRPQPGAGTTAAAASGLGMDVWEFPLFTVRPVSWDPPDPSEIDALLIGSGNAVRHAGAALARFIAKPVYAVGETTAGACRAAGLTVAMAGGGNLQPLLERVPVVHRRLLRLAGRERVEIVPRPGQEIVERVVYASDPLPLPPALADILRRRAVTLLHSAEAARHFAAECDRLDLPRSAISLAAIGPRVAAAAGQGWATVAVAETPDDAALLAQAAQLCQNPRQQTR